VGGIPFFQFEPQNNAEGKSITFPLPTVIADRLYFLGLTNSPDLAHPAWGGGDSFQNFFIGDSDGRIELKYASGKCDEIPLVFGYTIFWRQIYGISSAPFSTNAAARARLDAALCVLNGLDAYKENEPFCLCVIPRQEPLVSMTVVDNPKKIGFPAIEGLTFSTRSNLPQTDATTVSLGDFQPDTNVGQWLNTHSVEAANPFPPSRRRAVKALQNFLYTTPADLTLGKVRRAAASVELTANNLPSIHFHGSVEAEILSEVYRENSAELLTRVDPDGMVHESNPTADNYNGFGGFTPDMGPFKTDYYTRNWAPVLLNDWGCFTKASATLDFFDRALMFFPESFPKLQMDGKPVPGHATVICNKPLVYYDGLRLGGWPTKYTSHDMGNPETDGHGYMMLSHYSSWVKSGRSPAWVQAHWPALQEAAEFIPWQLDNPKLSFSEHGLLYSESEGGMNKCSFFCNVPCWLGLLGFAEMADASGHAEKAARWRTYANKLQAAMEAYFPTNNKTWGKVWDPKKTADWGGYPIAAMAPILFGADYWGFDLRRQMPDGWAECADRTWKMSLAAMQPEGCASCGFGYGQAHYALSGLLLDDTAHTGKIVDWTARMIFAPSQSHSFRVPEGVVMATDQSMWRRWGDLGNLYQMSAVLRVIQVMTGIDDLSSGELRIMPRIPAHWSGLSVENQPVNALSDGRSQIVRLQFNYARDPAGRHFNVDLNPDLPLDRVRVRVGPTAQGSFESALDGRPVKVEPQTEGDARWAWLTLNHLSPGKHRITIKEK
jgi:hypothetical protein